MPTSKKQLKRLVKFVAMLKENRFPNCHTFLQELKKEDIQNNQNVFCKASKTIQRDIKTLKEEFGAPIDYDYDNKGYYLKRRDWDFPCPSFEEHEMIASVLGARVAEDIFPEPLRSKIRSAVDFQLTTNNPDFLDSAKMDALVISSGLKATIDPDVFNCIFDGWKEHRGVFIKYRDVNDRSSSRLIEPHVLAFHNSAWFVKAFCLKEKAKRTFAMHRIEEAELSDRSFEPDKEMIEETKEMGPFDYNVVKNVRIHCSRTVKKFIVEKPLHKEQSIEQISENEYSVFLPSVWEPEIIQWILYQGGQAKIVKPASLSAKIRHAAEKIILLHPDTVSKESVKKSQKILHH